MKKGTKSNKKNEDYIIKQTVPTILPDGFGISLGESGITILKFRQRVSDKEMIEIGSFALPKEAVIQFHETLTKIKEMIENEDTNS